MGYLYTCMGCICEIRLHIVGYSYACIWCIYEIRSNRRLFIYMYGVHMRDKIPHDVEDPNSNTTNCKLLYELGASIRDRH